MLCTSGIQTWTPRAQAQLQSHFPVGSVVSAIYVALGVSASVACAMSHVGLLDEGKCAWPPPATRHGSLQAVSVPDRSSARSPT
eukprot:s6540_g3.t1